MSEPIWAAYHEHCNDLILSSTWWGGGNQNSSKGSMFVRLVEHDILMSKVGRIARDAFVASCTVRRTCCPTRLKPIYIFQRNDPRKETGGSSVRVDTKSLVPRMGSLSPRLGPPMLFLWAGCSITRAVVSSGDVPFPGDVRDVETQGALTILSTL